MSISTYKLENKNGMAITVTNFGCAIIKLEVPGNGGKLYDVALGLDKAEDYATVSHPYFGVIAGRVANRIGKGQFTLAGKSYQLETNDGNHHLHGGIKGFDKQEWQVLESTSSKIVFMHNSPDGEGNYPGSLCAKVTYTLCDENIFRIDYDATTDTETICNLTNHNYFNLEGFDAKNVYNHELEILSDKITAVDDELIPTGEFVPVAGTAFDFNTVKTIGQDLEAAGKVSNTGGYDHNFVLRAPGKAASVYSPLSGIRMTIYTDSPGMQLYTGNMIPTGSDAITAKGVTYGVHSAFCVETQIFPDAINHTNFPSCVVTKDRPQKHYTEFRFEF